LNLIGDSVYSEFLVATEVPRLAFSCTTPDFVGLKRYHGSNRYIGTRFITFDATP
jgi:hypothetical protein